MRRNTCRVPYILFTSFSHTSSLYTLLLCGYACVTFFPGLFSCLTPSPDIHLHGQTLPRRIHVNITDHRRVQLVTRRPHANNSANHASMGFSPAPLSRHGVHQGCFCLRILKRWTVSVECMKPISWHDLLICTLQPPHSHFRCCHCQR